MPFATTGHKLVYLYDECQTPLLYRTRAPWSSQRRWPASDDVSSTGSGANLSRTALGTVSQVNVEQPDIERFPLFECAARQECLLGPGDSLYIPARCWHWVKSLSVSISVSFVL
jgi:hypothetical protein